MDHWARTYFETVQRINLRRDIRLSGEQGSSLDALQRPVPWTEDDEEAPDHASLVYLQLLRFCCLLLLALAMIRMPSIILAYKYLWGQPILSYEDVVYRMTVGLVKRGEKCTAQGMFQCPEGTVLTQGSFSTSLVRSPIRPGLVSNCLGKSSCQLGQLHQRVCYSCSNIDHLGLIEQVIQLQDILTIALLLITYYIFSKQKELRFLSKMQPGISMLSLQIRDQVQTQLPFFFRKRAFRKFVMDHLPNANIVGLAVPMTKQEVTFLRLKRDLGLVQECTFISSDKRKRAMLELEEKAKGLAGYEGLNTGWVTFGTGIDRQRAMAKLEEQGIIVKDCAPPQNISWDNLSIAAIKRYLCNCLLLGTGILVFGLSSMILTSMKVLKESDSEVSILLGIVISVYGIVISLLVKEVTKRFFLISDVSMLRTAIFLTNCWFQFAFDYLLFIPVSFKLQQVHSLEGWIKKAGSVIFMLSAINLFTKPLTEQLLARSIQAVKRLHDRGWRLLSSNQTRAEHRLQYADIHDRQQITYETQYSHLLQHVWGALVFMPMLPGLPLLTAASLCADYWQKKVLLLAIKRNTSTRDMQLFGDFVEGLFWSLLVHFCVGYLLTNEKDLSLLSYVRLSWQDRHMLAAGALIAIRLTFLGRKIILSRYKLSCLHPEYKDLIGRQEERMLDQLAKQDGEQPSEVPGIKEESALWLCSYDRRMNQLVSQYFLQPI